MSEIHHHLLTAASSLVFRITSLLVIHIVFLFLCTDSVCSQLEDNQRVCACLLLGLKIHALHIYFIISLFIFLHTINSEHKQVSAWTQVCRLIMGSVKPFLLLLLPLMFFSRLSQLWAFPFSPSLDLDVTPRTTVFSKGEDQADFLKIKSLKLWLKLCTGGLVVKKEIILIFQNEIY